jgi:hypothetical protein
MKKALLILLTFVGITSYSQSTSTDLTLSMTDPVLLDEMDSLMFDSAEFGELYLAFDVTDTVYFNGFNVEISVSGSDHVLYKGVFPKTELLADGYLNPNWNTNMSLGKLEKINTYVISFVTKDINGLLGPVITKQFTYAGN